jgi:hypothetical protein
MVTFVDTLRETKQMRQAVQAVFFVLERVRFAAFTIAAILAVKIALAMATPAAERAFAAPATAPAAVVVSLP